jgi:hypothetical protein
MKKIKYEVSKASMKEEEGGLSYRLEVELVITTAIWKRHSNKLSLKVPI